MTLARSARTPAATSYHRRGAAHAGSPRPDSQRTAPPHVAGRGVARSCACRRSTRRADGRRRGVPRPARPGAARERAARPDRALELPDRRPGGRASTRPPRAPTRSRRRGRCWRAGGPGDRARAGDGDPGRGRPPFAGGLVGFLGYDLGRRFERLPAIARVDQHLPVLRLALHDWAIAWDRRSGSRVAGRAGGRRRRRTGRRADGRGSGPARRAPGGGLRTGAPSRATGRSSSGRPRRPSRPGRRIAAWIAGVEAVRERHRPRRDLPGQPDPPPRGAVRRRPVAALPPAADRGPGAVRRVPGPRALARHRRAPRPPLGLAGAVPLRGRRRARVARTRSRARRPRGRTRDEDRALARELLASRKDQAENVMIVDVLRNDLGRVCEPGSVRVPRLLRLERTAAVQHLVTTVTGQLRPDARRLRPARGRRSPAARSRAPRRSGRWSSSRGWSRSGAARTAGRCSGWARTGGSARSHPDPHVRRGRRAADAPRRRRDHLAQRPAGRVGRDGREGARAAVVDRGGGGPG